jgi:hypothetical protein
MERLAEIRLTKSILLIPEKVLWTYLPVSEIEEGIKRGKGYKRGLQAEKRQKGKNEVNE